MLKIFFIALILIGFGVYLYFLIRQYRIYLNWLSIRPPKNKEKRHELLTEKKKSQHQVFQLMVIGIVVLTTGLTVLTFLTGSLGGGKADSNISELKEYNSTGKWRISEFNWKKAIDDPLAKEVDLSENIEPYIGPNSVNMISGAKTDTLTVSIFAVGLTEASFKQAEVNSKKMLRELQKESRLVLMDFAFSYKDAEGKMQKVSHVYSREKANGPFVPASQ